MSQGNDPPARGGRRGERREGRGLVSRPRLLPRRGWLSPPLALFLLLTGVYLLTSGGHTYSYDEETMFGLTESLVERGSLVVPTCGNCTVLRSIPMPEGRNYSRYGPVQSLVAIPAYLLGRALGGEDDAARWFGTRFFATLLTAPVTAGIGVLLYALIRALGYRGRIALATALLYGLGTQAWPRAKTFFADPLTTLLILGAVWCWWRLDTGMAQGQGRDTARYAMSWAAGIGLCCGLALGTKFAAAIIVPIFGLAGAASLWRGWRGGVLSRRDLTLAVAAGALALAGPLTLVGSYNWARFASPLETGYGGREVGAVQAGDWWGGLLGQVVSPGKGLLVFSPVVVLGIVSWWPFWRRHRRLAMVTGALIVAHLAFYARVPQWDAGTSWGPRYLDFIVPLLVLPIAAGFAALVGRGRVARLALGGGVAAVVACALVVQLLGVLVNFDTGYNSVTTGRRYWTVANAPPLVHARMLRERAGAWWLTRFPQGDSVTPVRGIALQQESEPLWPRYSPRETTVRVHAAGTAPLVGLLVYDDARERREPPQRIAILIDGRPIALAPETAAPDFGPTAYRLTFPLRGAGERRPDVLLTIRNEGFGTLGPSRTLDLAIAADGGILLVVRRPLLLPFPDDTPERWSWFFTDRNQHLVDLWPWYLAVARLPVGFARLLAVGVGGGGAVALVAGLGGLLAAGRGRSGRP